MENFENDSERKRCAFLKKLTSSNPFQKYFLLARCTAFSMHAGPGQLKLSALLLFQV